MAITCFKTFYISFTLDNGSCLFFLKSVVISFRQYLSKVTFIFFGLETSMPFIYMFIITTFAFGTEKKLSEIIAQMIIVGVFCPLGVKNSL